MKSPKIHALFVLAIAAICGGSTAAAQQSETSLFVIKPPKVAELRYGQSPGFRINQASSGKKRQEEQVDSARPREDLGLDSDAKRRDDGDDGDGLSRLLESSDDSYADDLDSLRDDLDDDSFDPARAKTITTWNQKPMTSLKLGLTEIGVKTPDDSSWQLTSRTSSLAFSQKTFAWAAPEIRYQPLFFEDVALERYGQTKGLYRQPIASSIRFLANAALLPYTSLHDPIDSCDYPLGYCRPGDSVSCVKQRHFFESPWSRR